MKNNTKKSLETITWIILLSPTYLLWTYLDYLSKNVWGTRNSEPVVQLIFPITIVLFVLLILMFVFAMILYKDVLISRDNNKAETYTRGRWFFDKIFIRRYTTYIDSGKTYWVDNETEWYTLYGDKVGRINWITKQHNKNKIIKKVKKLKSTNSI